MPKLGMEAVRQRQLIEATMLTIHEVGFQKTTLSRVARRAGISPGLVAHYFRDKAGLLEATMRHIAEDLRLEMARRVSGVRDPRARLAAILAANFSERCFAPATVSAWLAFWGQAHGDPQLNRMQRILRSRLKSNLAYALRGLVPAEDAARIAMALSVFIDGLSLRHALGERTLDRETAHALARDYLDSQLAHTDPRKKGATAHAELA